MSSVGDINVGDVRRLTGVFQDVNDVNTDPATITVKVNDGTTTITYVYGVDSDVIRDSVGTYHIDVALTNSGRWRYQWVGVGTVDAVEEDYFDVAASVL